MTLLLRFHQWLSRRSGGRIGHGWLGRPALLLHTTGAKTAERRVAALIYAAPGDELAVIASAGGAPHHPGWYHNLLAAPTVRVQRGRESAMYRARAVEGHERAIWWDRANSVNRNAFDEYQANTDRTIPVVVLSPVDGSAPR